MHALGGVLDRAGLGGWCADGLMLVTRKAFFVLIALVAVQAQLRRPEGTRTFWRRRLPLVALPYAAWTAIYAMPRLLASPDVAAALRRYLGLLATGDGSYHLYFLLASLQVYLVLPVAIRLVQRAGRLQGPLLVASLALQVSQHAFIEYGTAETGVLGWYRHNCGELAVTYQFWVLLGLLAGLHLPRVQQVVDAAAAWFVVAMLGCAALAVVHVRDSIVGGEAPGTASSTFSPYLIPWYVAAIVGTYALTSRYARWATRTGHRVRLVSAGASASFGVYLAHPLLLPAAGRLLDLVVPGLPLPARVVLVTLVTAAVTMLGVGLLRRTPVSRALCGRPWQRGG